MLDDFFEGLDTLDDADLFDSLSSWDDFPSASAPTETQEAPQPAVPEASQAPEPVQPWPETDKDVTLNPDDLFDDLDDLMGTRGEFSESLLNMQKEEERSEALAAGDPEAIAAYRRMRAHRIESEDEPEEFSSEESHQDIISQLQEQDGGYEDERKENEHESEWQPSRTRRLTEESHSRRRSSRIDEVNKRAYNVDPDERTDADKEYDGYYDNVPVLDDGKSSEGGFNYKMIGVFGASILMMVLAIYFVISQIL